MKKSLKTQYLVIQDIINDKVQEGDLDYFVEINNKHYKLASNKSSFNIYYFATATYKILKGYIETKKCIKAKKIIGLITNNPINTSNMLSFHNMKNSKNFNCKNKCLNSIINDDQDQYLDFIQTIIKFLAYHEITVEYTTNMYYYQSMLKLLTHFEKITLILNNYKSKLDTFIVKSNDERTSNINDIKSFEEDILRIETNQISSSTNGRFITSLIPKLFSVSKENKNDPVCKPKSILGKRKYKVSKELSSANVIKNDEIMPSRKIVSTTKNNHKNRINCHFIDFESAQENNSYNYNTSLSHGISNDFLNSKLNYNFPFEINNPLKNDAEVQRTQFNIQSTPIFDSTIKKIYTPRVCGIKLISPSSN